VKGAVTGIACASSDRVEVSAHESAWPLRVIPQSLRYDDLRRARLHAIPELPDAGADHVRVDHRIWSDLQEADPRFTAAVGLLIRLQDSATNPEAAEDISPLFVSPVHDLGLTVQLDGGWWKKPRANLAAQPFHVTA
jgi:hypothetical protein